MFFSLANLLISARENDLKKKNGNKLCVQYFSRYDKKRRDDKNNNNSRDSKKLRKKTIHDKYINMYNLASLNVSKCCRYTYVPVFSHSICNKDPTRHGYKCDAHAHAQAQAYIYLYILGCMNMEHMHVCLDLLKRDISTGSCVRVYVSLSLALLRKHQAILKRKAHHQSKRSN